MIRFLFLATMILQITFGQSISFSANYYVDSTLGSDSYTGIDPNFPWQTLAAVNSRTFQPGDSIFLKSQSIWTGQLNPKGSGSTGNPITIDQYGTGEKPIIDGGGSTGDGVVYLHNQEYWEINNLEITNNASEEGDRRGVLIRAENFGRVDHIYLKNLTIHHIKGLIGQGMSQKNTGGIGIILQADDLVDTRFNDILIQGCTIATVDNTGIFSVSMAGGSNTPGGTNWNRRKITNWRVRNNVIHDVAKNAMIIRLTDESCVVEYNVCYNTCMRVESGNTIFARSSRGTVFQYNEGYQNQAQTVDGCLYDADMESPETVWQYSYSHDNNHGLMWFATQPEDYGFIIRYNISQNDKGRLIALRSTFVDAYIYNNVFFVGSHRSPEIIHERGSDRTYYYYNNIVYNQSPTAVYTWDGAARHIDSNLFYGIHPASEPSDPHKITADPRFVNPGSGGIGINTVNGYQLKGDSPCIDSGRVIPNQGGKDYWGNPVPNPGGAPDRGAHEYQPPEKGDFDRDKDIDTKDLSFLLRHWLSRTDLTPFTETESQVVMEAEHFHSRTSGSGVAAGVSWEPRTGQGSLGEGYLETPDTGITVNDPDIETNSPRLSYWIDFQDLGTYYVWVKADGPGGGSDSLHYGLNGQAISTGYDDSLEVDKLGYFSWKSSTKTIRPVLEIATPGVHSLDIWMREDGVKLDRLLLTGDESYIPEYPLEYSAFTTDLNQDRIVNLKDYTVMADGWLPVGIP